MVQTPGEKRASDKVSVEVSNLTRRYGAFTALDGISFQVRAGEIVGFLGPNGAGKTTTMKILTCFLAPDGGSAKVAGFDVEDESLEVRERVGYLPETVPLYEDMLVYDYLEFVAKMRKVPGAQVHARIRETATVCGLAHMINRPIRELSKGYRQRVGLSQALIHKPEVVILDEPTSGLDPNQLVEIRDLIKEIGREKTILFSTHILQEVAAVCDRILVIHKGRLVADGTVAELEEQVRGGELYILTLRSPKGRGVGDIESQFKALQGAREARVVSRGDEEWTLELRADSGTDLREEIVRCAQRENLMLLESRRQELTLEEIFRALTGEEGV